jgi:small subunit ribosomal protein S4
MSRYVGPRVRVMRALGIQLPGLSTKTLERRPNPPGQHGGGKRKSNKSDYALRLREKQKLRFNYGLTEGQMRRLVVEATRSRANTAYMLIQLLERRLDNVVFRAGLARTIPGARQLVAHGHVLVNGGVCDRPSRRLERGDVVSVRPSGHPVARHALANGGGHVSPWLETDADALTVKVAAFPEASFLPFELEPRLIIEHYSRAM